MFKVDLNCDLGESFGHYKLGLDEEVIQYISSANIACGFHASDPINMQKTIELAKKYNLIVTGGSDYHGSYAKNRSIGCCTTPKESIEFIMKKY